MSKPFFFSKVILTNAATIAAVLTLGLNQLLAFIPAPYDQIATPVVAAAVAAFNIWLRVNDPAKPITVLPEAK